MRETRETREKETERERDKREKTGIKSVRLEDCFFDFIETNITFGIARLVKNQQ